MKDAIRMKVMYHAWIYHGTELIVMLFTWKIFQQGITILVDHDIYIQKSFKSLGSASNI